ncbi:DUF4355 domain-containing protein [Streptococcus parauberis]|uniref:DUF4355 domain-containing protein n=1 Tax=Streptococcus parauberis TaxID=1348 RepID=UPI000E30366B|nr:DUF4355 domain-containing protein [Streptococcus parauberis]RFE01080.1 hypothetical protein ADO06_01953 [Streptococcus parauberis]
MTKDLIKMNLRNLQMFAEDGSEHGTDTDQHETAQQGGDENKDKTYSQSDLDSYTNKAVQKALANKEKDFQSQIEKEVANRIAKEKDYAQLSDEDRKQRDFEDQQKILADERAQFEHEKLVVQLQSDLVKKNLPADLAETFALHKDKEEALKAVGIFETAFNEAVAEEFKKSVRQSDPNLGSGSMGSQSNWGSEFAKRSSVKLNNKPFGN